MSRKTKFPRKYWAFLSPKGELLPSTIREREGDCYAALLDSWACKRKDGPALSQFKKVRVTVGIEA